MYLFFFPPPNPGRNPGQKSGQKPGQKSGQNSVQQIDRPLFEKQIRNLQKILPEAPPEKPEIAKKPIRHNLRNLAPGVLDCSYSFFVVCPIMFLLRSCFLVITRYHDSSEGRH